MPFHALLILACVGFTTVGVTAGSFAALWQSGLGTGPISNTLLSAAMGVAYAATVVSTSTSATFVVMFYRVKILFMPPPEKLEWRGTDSFKNIVWLVMLLSVILLVTLKLRRRQRKRIRAKKGWVSQHIYRTCRNAFCH